MLPVLLMLAAVVSPFGVNNPDVTQDNISTTICSPGWASAQRPPQFKTWRIKKKMLIAQGRYKNGHRYILDHVIPLEIGGAPLAPDNFILQTYRASLTKDKVEGRLHDQVCNGTITLDNARVMILDWRVIARRNHFK